MGAQRFLWVLEVLNSSRWDCQSTGLLQLKAEPSLTNPQVIEIQVSGPRGFDEKQRRNRKLMKGSC